MSSIVQDSVSDTEKPGGVLNEIIDTSGDITDTDNTVVEEVEYVTGWRFAAVDIAIVLSMFCYALS